MHLVYFWLSLLVYFLIFSPSFLCENSTSIFAAFVLHYIENWGFVIVYF